jgi:uncharacterized membrane protein YdjX (TVP38/TMEM64 family)
MKYLKIGLLLGIVAVIWLSYHFGLQSYLTFEALKSNQGNLLTYYGSHKVLVIMGYMLAYILITGISLPGATIMTLAGGAIFGSVFGTGVILLSATVGATLALLFARFILRDTLEKKYSKQVDKMNEGVTKNAFQYLLFLRLVPLFPFFLVNLVLGLTRIPVRTFFIGSLVGMLPGTFVFANAGYQLSSITSLGDILSPGLLGAFALLGCLALVPMIYKKVKG